MAEIQVGLEVIRKSDARRGRMWAKGKVERIRHTDSLGNTIKPWAWVAWEHA